MRRQSTRKQTTRVHLENDRWSPQAQRGLNVSRRREMHKSHSVGPPSLSMCASSPGDQLKAAGGCRKCWSQSLRPTEAVHQLTSSQLASAAYRCLRVRMFRSMCAPKILPQPPQPPNTHVPPSPSHSSLVGRIKREHLFRQLVSVTGGMQPRAEVTERFWFVHKKAACEDRVTARLESGAG